MKKVNLFLVGAPKCGTTALYAYLKQHKDIWFPEVKEPHHFCTDFHAQANVRGQGHRFYFADTDKYKHLYASQNTSTKYIWDASASYLSSTNAAQHIHTYNPKAKIIIIVREPISFIKSLWKQNKKWLHETESIDTALNLEIERRSGMHMPDMCKFDACLQYRSQADFASQVQRYVDIFPKEQLLFLIYEEFKQDNQKQLENIFRFLELEKKQYQQTIQKNTSSIMPQYMLKKFSNHLLDNYFSHIGSVRYQWHKIWWYGLWWLANKIWTPLDASLDKTLEQETKKACTAQVKKLETLLQKNLCTLRWYET